MVQADLFYSIMYSYHCARPLLMLCKMNVYCFNECFAKSKQKENWENDIMRAKRAIGDYDECSSI